MPQNLQSIQFLRFVAAILVVIYHAEFLMAAAWPSAVSPFVSYVYGIGAAGVHIFFVISGFVMVYVKSKSPGEFLYRRMVRVFPIYWVIAAVYLSVHGIHASAFDTVKSLLLLPGYAPAIIGPGWTLSYELYFYVCLSLAMSFRYGLHFLTGFFLAMVGARAVLHPANAMLDVMTNTLLLEFLAGAWMAKALPRMVVGAAGALMILVLGIAGFVAGLWLGYSRFPSALIWGIPAALVVLGAVLSEKNLPAFIRKLSFLGDSSYSLYLLHILLVDGLMIATTHLLSPSVFYREPLCLLFAVICCGVGICCFNWIEKPLIGSIKRKRGIILSGTELRLSPKA